LRLILKSVLIKPKKGALTMRTSLTISIGMLSVLPLFAQGGGLSDLPMMLLALMAIAALLILSLVVLVGNSMLQVRAKELGVAGTANYSVVPSLEELIGSGKKVTYIKDEESVIALKKGYEIKLKGAVADPSIHELHVRTCAVQPPNFRGNAPIPKIEVETGVTVKAGDVLFFDKRQPEIKFVSPVSGEYIELRRGEKRAVTHLVLLADNTQQYRTLTPPDFTKASREDLVDFLCDSGFWPFILQRPFNELASTTEVPRDIFISTFDTAPLAPDNNLIVDTDREAFQKGLEVLARLTDGAVHLGLNAGGEKAPSSAFTEATGVQKHWFRGKHPAGCVGVQIHHIKPIRAGEIVWTLAVQDVMMLGRLFRDKRFDASRIVALTGAELVEPRYVQTYIGANMGELVKDNLDNDHVRLVSGDLLTGQSKSADDFLNAHDDQVSVIQEGDYYEMFGWLLPLKPRPSFSRTFPAFLMPNMQYRVDTNTHGEERAFVVTGLYERVTPMDIYPQHLLKAAITGDIENMEGLGIYEVVEEDLALCEFVCPSKVPVQKILREGLDMIKEQG
jgi:Na+-transporting NADH:ubiquinone oxidoreductase subunit A